MGQKVNPIGYRLALTRDWRSRWYASTKDFPEFLHTDIKIRDYVKKRLAQAAVSKVVIERAWNSLRVTIYTARPGIVIGRKGTEIEKMTEDIAGMSGGKQVKIDIQEIKTPELDAQLVSENIAMQIERRISFRRAMKKAVQTTMGFGAKGVKVRCAGRLGGAEISRAERYHEGMVPLHTLRQAIDYGFSEAMTVYGKIGVKVWLCKPEGADNVESVQAGEGGQRERGDRRDRRDRGDRGGRGGDRGDRGDRGEQPKVESAPTPTPAPVPVA